MHRNRPNISIRPPTTAPGKSRPTIRPRAWTPSTAVVDATVVGSTQPVATYFNGTTRRERREKARADAKAAKAAKSSSAT